MTACLSESPVDSLQLPWRHSFAALGEDFFVAQQPTPVPAPVWVGRTLSLAQEIGLTSFTDDSTDWLAALAGNQPANDRAPLASVYSGHQFGVWAGQLGDGRALLLGELAGQEIQLKGAGLTPFSRMGDGRAVLRSSIREFLCSEAMHALGIATTRALSVIGSDLPVRRETLETAAVLTRVAPSFLRFGHFEHFYHHDQPAQLKQLADFVIDRFYPGCRIDQRFGGNAYASLLQAVAARTARMVAQWQAVGFCHGVMNTDNMSILGLTIDYGPFQFLDAFDPDHICNHSDHQGRYAFGKQPQVAYWNLSCLGQALLPLIGEPALAVAALATFKPLYDEHFAQQMAHKLGFDQATPEVSGLADAILQLLAQERVDYTIFWRRLSHWAARTDGADNSVRELFLEAAGMDKWLLHFSELRAQYPRGFSADSMLKTNPKFVLRNHLCELAIEAARNQDFTVLSHLQTLLEQPFDEHSGNDEWAGFPPDWASSISISCSS
jgi:uncharacterized protein YdiU (UPF0061 family)